MLVKALIPLLLVVVLSADGDLTSRDLASSQRSFSNHEIVTNDEKGEAVFTDSLISDEQFIAQTGVVSPEIDDWTEKVSMLCEALAAGDEIDPDLAVTEAFCSMINMPVRLRAPSNEEFPLDLYVAVLTSQRSAGYQLIDSEIVKHTGMLFVYPRPMTGSFHMCNVREPLWIFWFRPDGSLLDATVMQPGRSVPAFLCTDEYGPKVAGSYLFAIELGEEVAKSILESVDRVEELSLVVEPWMTL